MVRALGLMSGTSMDGVDLALIETDGDARLSFGPTSFRAYDDRERSVLRAALVDARGVDDRSARPGMLAPAEQLVTASHVAAVRDFLSRHDIDVSGIDIVGFHGQTVIHRPERGLTIQIGDGAALARQLGIAVMGDMRAADVASGGQGAPLVPVFHRALVRSVGLPEPALVVNIGGVANVTFVDGNADPIACDTGPGNALLDDLMLERTGEDCDRDGAAAAGGRVDEAVLRRLLDNPFFAAPLPKSLDRNDFSSEAVASLSTADAAATLTAFTAASIAAVLGHLPGEPAVAVICGGGARNPTLMAALREVLPCPVKTAEAVGWQAEAVEAQAFAYLAVRAQKDLPLTFPHTTGVDRPLSGGVLFRP